MVIGHIETIEERIEHMRLLRDLQDETGGFTAFIHWTFQPEGTPLGRWKQLPSQNVQRCESENVKTNPATPFSPFHASTLSRPQRLRPDGKHLLLADAHEYLLML